MVPRLDLLEQRTLLAGAWAPIGPAPILNGQTPGSLPVTGRLAAVAGDPEDANTLYVAAAGGGVWKTTNGGANWAPLTDSQTTLKMGALAVAPSEPNVIYAGTGEANFSGDSFYGRGVLKSTDGGSTWTLLGTAQFNRRTISQIVVNRKNPDVVYLTVSGGGVNGLGGNTGVWKSTDGGVSWTNTTTSISTTEPFTDVAIDREDNDNTLVAAVGDIFGSSVNGVYKTTNGGASWTLVGGGLPSGVVDGRIRVASAPTPRGGRVLYASIAGSGRPNSTAFGTLFRVMRSDNDGKTWANVTPLINYMGRQGWYDTTLALDRALNVYVAGQVTVLESTDDGASWSNISVGVDGKGPHADHHGIGFDAEGRLLDGNDGGFWRLDDKNPQHILWSDLNGNPGSALQITTFVGIAQDPSTANVVYGGSQDNGREKFTGALAWNEIRGGDGGYIRVDPVTPTTVYGEFQNVGIGTLERSTNGGLSWVGGIGPPPIDGNFYQPYVIDPTNHLKLLFGNAVLWQTLNQGGSWTAIGIPGVNGFNTGGRAIDAVSTNGTTIYVSASGHIFVSTNNGATWTQRDLPGALATVPALLAVPASFAGPGFAFAVHNAFGVGKVFFTFNFGVTWFDDTATLPAIGNDDLPAWSVAFDTTDGGNLYLGTDNGVYRGPGPFFWTTVSRATLPDVQVTGLELNAGLNVLDAGTYGRGVFRISLTGALDPENESWKNGGAAAPRAAVLLNPLPRYAGGLEWSAPLSGQAVTSAGDKLLLYGLDPVNLDYLFASNRAGKSLTLSDSRLLAIARNGGLTEHALQGDVLQSPFSPVRSRNSPALSERE